MIAGSRSVEAVCIQLDRSRIRAEHFDGRSRNVKRVDRLGADLSRAVAVAVDSRYREGPDEVVATLWVRVHSNQAAVKLDLIGVGVAHVEDHRHSCLWHSH